MAPKLVIIMPPTAASRSPGRSIPRLTKLTLEVVTGGIVVAAKTN
jgi:hypothetical protein